MANPSYQETATLTWRGRDVPRVLALWIDALMDDPDAVYDLTQSSRRKYLDVKLTSKPPGEIACKHEITRK